MDATKNMTAAEKLDAVLSVFPYNDPGPVLEDRLHITNLLKAMNISFEGRLLDEMMIHLEKKEGYLRHHDIYDMKDGKTVIGHRWYLTFEGEMFKENGGYEAKFLALDAERKMNEAEIERLKRFDQQNLDNQTALNLLTSRLVWGTWIAGIGTGFLALIELLKLCWPYFSFHIPHNCQ